MSDATLYLDPCVGWRCWEVARIEGELRLISHGATIWPTDGPLVAECGAGRSHSAPAVDCRCGIYALIGEIPYYSYDGNYRCFGQVELYGSVICGTQGFRAEKARPLCLYLATKDFRLAAPMREAYRVPVKLVDPFAFSTGQKED
jgi:hypothetical protein